MFSGPVVLIVEREEILRGSEFRQKGKFPPSRPIDDGRTTHAQRGYLNQRETMTQIEISSSLFRFLLLLLSNEGKKEEDKEEEEEFKKTHCGARTPFFFAGKKNKRSKSRNAFLIAGETEKNNDPSRREKTHVMAGMLSDSWRARVCVCFSIDE